MHTYDFLRNRIAYARQYGCSSNSLSHVHVHLALKHVHGEVLSRAVETHARTIDDPHLLIFENIHCCIEID